MRKLIKIFRNWFYTKLDILGKEVSMSILGFFFLFITIYFLFNMQTNRYFLFFVLAYGILTFFLFVPYVKHVFNSKSEIIKTEENSVENNNIQKIDITTNVLINDISQNNFTENNYNTFIEKVEDKSKKADEFDEELKYKLVKIAEDLKIIEQKDFIILLLFVKQKEYPLKKYKWLVENFNSIFNLNITEQYVNQIKNTELEIFNKNVEFTRVQKKSYELFERIKSYFIDKNE